MGSGLNDTVFVQSVVHIGQTGERSKQHSVCTKCGAYWSNASNYLKLGNKQTHTDRRSHKPIFFP